MISYDRISSSVKDILDSYGKTDVYTLAKSMGILLNACNFGDDEESIKGFIVEYNDIQCISYNDDLSERIKEIVIAHEIGHSVLHSPIGMQGFTDVFLYSQNNHMEEEANLFCAEYLIDDDEVLEMLNEGQTFFELARSLEVPEEIVDYKLRMLTSRGYHFNDSPIYSKNNFMGKIK